MTDPTPPTDERLAEWRQRVQAGWVPTRATMLGWLTEIHRLTITLTDQEHELIGLRAEREEMREAAEILDAAYALMQLSYGPDTSVAPMIRDVERARAALAATTTPAEQPAEGQEDR